MLSPVSRFETLYQRDSIFVLPVPVAITRSVLRALSRLKFFGHLADCFLLVAAVNDPGFDTDLR